MSEHSHDFRDRQRLIEAGASSELAEEIVTLFNERNSELALKDDMTHLEQRLVARLDGHFDKLTKHIESGLQVAHSNTAKLIAESKWQTALVFGGRLSMFLGIDRFFG